MIVECLVCPCCCLDVSGCVVEPPTTADICLVRGSSGKMWIVAIWIQCHGVTKASFPAGTGANSGSLSWQTASVVVWTILASYPLGPTIPNRNVVFPPRFTLGLNALNFPYPPDSSEVRSWTFVDRDTLCCRKMIYVEPRLCLSTEINNDSYVYSKQIAMEPHYPTPVRSGRRQYVT
jgi:hypothetical protein